MLTDTDTAGRTATDRVTTVIETAAQPPLTVDTATGTSFRFDYSPTGTVG